jgi:aminoglycoside phosphotransferase (APT) family kinase protein
MANTLDVETVGAQLSEWLQRKLPDKDVELSGVEMPTSSGLSNETVMFDATGGKQTQRLVARVQPSGPAVFPSYDLEREFRVMKIVGEKTSVPVPAVRWYEPDPAVLGAPFIVMDRVAGNVAADDPPFTTAGWLIELDPTEQAAVQDNALRLMADVHATDWRGLGLEFLDMPELGETGTEQKLGWYEHFYEWAAEQGQRSPTIEAALEWLRANQPSAEPTVLIHGDCRLGNMVVQADLSVAGLLDWELAMLGPPGLDLGWALFVNRHHTDGVGAPRPPGFPSAEEIVARYEELSGNPVAEHIRFYEALGGMLFVISMVRVSALMVAAGLLPADTPMAVNNPAAQQLAKVLDLPAPGGVAENFIGNRGA